MVSGSLALLYFLLGFYGGRQGSSPDRGQSPVEWGDFPSGLRPGWLGLRPGWLGLRPGWMAQRGERTYVRTDGRTDVRTENLPILQDFVPYRGHCPKKRVEFKGLNNKVMNSIHVVDGCNRVAAGGKGARVGVGGPAPPNYLGPRGMGIRP